MDSESSLPHSRELSTCPYSVPNQSGPHYPILSLKDPSWYYPPTYVLVFLLTSFFSLSSQYSSSQGHRLFISSSVSIGRLCDITSKKSLDSFDSIFFISPFIQLSTVRLSPCTKRRYACQRVKSNIKSWITIRSVFLLILIVGLL
jgi:hypothetical protein